MGSFWDPQNPTLDSISEKNRYFQDYRRRYREKTLFGEIGPEIEFLKPPPGNYFAAKAPPVRGVRAQDSSTTPGPGPGPRSRLNENGVKTQGPPGPVNEVSDLEALTEHPLE